MNPPRSRPSPNIHKNPSKYKFLPRNLQIPKKPQIAFRKVRQVCLKGLYIKNVLDQREIYDEGT